MQRVGITGANGFLGRALREVMAVHLGRFEVIPIGREVFADHQRLSDRLGSCDVIVHAAGVNRAASGDEVYAGNLELAERFISALERANVRPHILMTSSVQERFGNPYGESKRIARERIAHWAMVNGATFTGLILPNLFGPYGKPEYNSVIATFAYQLCRGMKPTILNDGTIQLLYVYDCAEAICQAIVAESNVAEQTIPATAQLSVSEILARFESFEQSYIQRAVFPQLETKLDRDLFNSFRGYVPLQEVFPRSLTCHDDPRGRFTELLRDVKAGQVSISTTRPGITRGNHFHTRKIERFIVVGGDAVIRLRRFKTSEVLEFRLSGSSPAFVDMPVWFTHSITNVGSEDLVTAFWINESYDPTDPDTFPEPVLWNSP